MQVNSAQRIAALVALAEKNIPTDVQELLVQGDPMRSIPPHALDAALTAALKAQEGGRHG